MGILAHVLHVQHIGEYCRRWTRIGYAHDDGTESADLVLDGIVGIGGVEVGVGVERSGLGGVAAGAVGGEHRLAGRVRDLDHGTGNAGVHRQHPELAADDRVPTRDFGSPGRVGIVYLDVHEFSDLRDITAIRQHA